MKQFQNKMLKKIVNFFEKILKEQTASYGEIVKKLKNEALEKITLEGYIEEANLDAICPCIFYVRYQAKTKDNKTYYFKEMVSKEYCSDATPIMNSYLLQRIHALETELPVTHIMVVYCDK